MFRSARGGAGGPAVERVTVPAGQGAARLRAGGARAVSPVTDTADGTLTEPRGRRHTATMQKLSIDARIREHLERAAASSTGRSAETVYGGHEHVLRQTLITLRAGTELAEHDNPGEATLLVLRGRVRLRSGEESWEGRTGDLLLVPAARHGLEALEDAAALLTVAKTG